MRTPSSAAFSRLVILLAISFFAAADSQAFARSRRCRGRSSRCAISGSSSCATAPQSAHRTLGRPPALASKPAVFVSPKGTRYSFVETNEPGTEDIADMERMQKRRALGVPGIEGELAARAELRSRSADNFVGTDRKAAKTSIADAENVNFQDLGELLASLVSDDAMLQLDISEDAESGRVAQEERNVTVNAYLYATKKESDNDYHLILGTSGSGRHQFMTAEVSGLPDGGPDLARLKEARQQFKDYFAASPIGTNYRRFTPPIPVTVSGSLFYDVDHRPGVVGPNGLKPKTSWEIHPVTTIRFEPE